MGPFEKDLEMGLKIEKKEFFPHFKTLEHAYMLSSKLMIFPKRLFHQLSNDFTLTLVIEEILPYLQGTIACIYHANFTTLARVSVDKLLEHSILPLVFEP